jgi:large repetitive protein
MYMWGASLRPSTDSDSYVPTYATTQTSPVLLPQGLTANKDITGVNAFESARNPYALNLDGASWGEVHDNASLDVTDEVSVECWAYWDASDTIASGIFGKWTAANQCYLLYKTNAGNGIRFYINGSAVGAGSLTDGWHHIVGTYDRTKKRLYIDGVQVNFNDQVDAIGTSSLPLEIGRYDQQPSYGYEEPIALPRIYNRALTATEVARNYNADRSKFGL